MRVIIVEDEALLVLAMQDLLESAGYVVVGTAARVATAMVLAETADFDVALLDMNLAGERIDPVANRIAGRGIPIVFVTGYGRRTLPPGVTAPVVDKPCTPEKLLPLLAALKGTARG